MPRIILAQCHQEISSFNPVRSLYDDFTITLGERMIETHSSSRDELGGALSVFDAAEGIVVVPTYSARSLTSGGVLAAADFERIAGEFLDGLRAASPVDGVYFALHGAMAAEQEDDPEGYLLDESRKILGEEIPIVISLDLHGILDASHVAPMRCDRCVSHLPACRLFRDWGEGGETAVADHAGGTAAGDGAGADSGACSRR